MIFHKGTDSHDYKYGAAIWESVWRLPSPGGMPRLPPRPCSIFRVRKRTIVRL